MSEILAAITVAEAAISLTSKAADLVQTLAAKQDVSDDVLAAHKKAADDAIAANQAIVDEIKSKQVS